MRTPAVLESVDPEEPPQAPIRVTNTPNETPISAPENRLPPDPALVEFDLSISELPELPMEAFDAIEELEPLEEIEELEALSIEDLDRPPTDTTTEDELAPLPVLTLPAPPKPPAVVLPMAATFVGSAVAAMAVVLLPWFAFVSPELEASRLARAAQAAPRVVEVPRPVPVPVPVVAPVVEPELEEPELEEPEPVVAVKPTPKRRTRRRAEPAPEPVVEPKPAAPVVVATAPPKPAPASEGTVPAQARMLAGTLNGSADGQPITLRLTFLPDGKLKANVNRSGSRTAWGSYTVSGKRATFALKESGDEGASYTGTVNASGASGRIVFADGERGRLKVKR